MAMRVHPSQLGIEYDESATNCYCRCHRKCVNEDRPDPDPADAEIEWTWDRKHILDSVHLSSDNREVLFHKHFSNGTSAVRGELALTSGQHYWEIKMTTSVYGTDMMIGVGTNAVNLGEFSSRFVSLLGKDSESWGLSYSGNLVHNGIKRNVCKRFGQGMTIGIHLDMWLGRLSLFRNGHHIGQPVTSGLRGKQIYPMACSTAARTGMKVVRSTSFNTSLQFMCCQVLRQCVPLNLNVSEAVNLAPGLRMFLENNLDWLVRPYAPEDSHAVVAAMRLKRSKCNQSEGEGGKQRKMIRLEQNGESSST